MNKIKIAINSYKDIKKHTGSTVKALQIAIHTFIHFKVK